MKTTTITSIVTNITVTTRDFYTPVRPDSLLCFIGLESTSIKYPTI